VVEYRVRIGDRELALSVGKNGQILIDGEVRPVEILQIDEHEFLVTSAPHQHRMALVRQGTGYVVVTEGMTLEAVVESPRERLIREHAHERSIEHARAEIHAPMPAMVVRVEVSEGEAVSAGQGLLVLEAMKMENELRAPRDGIIKAIHARPGNAVEKGALLMLLE
jgi:biotin carboxyl carrier protein